jgi:hypothetical protein
MPEIGSIWIDAISGRKRKRTKPVEHWFAVKARFAIQVEGQTAGLQSYEDRIVMVKALSVRHAKARLRPEFRRYGTPYLNPHGYMVRWRFERVLDTCEIFDEIDPRGVEVFSILGKRRVRPRFAWKVDRKTLVAKK